VAHEVNNPLAAILGFTDLLLENPEMPIAAREDLQIILQETQRTKEIVQDLLSFARQRPTQKEPVNVNAVLRQTIKLRSYDFSSHGVEVSEDFEANLSPTLGTPTVTAGFPEYSEHAYDAIQESGITDGSAYARGGRKTILKWRLWTTGREWWTRNGFLIRSLRRSRRKRYWAWTEHLLRDCARAWRRDFMLEQ